MNINIRQLKKWIAALDSGEFEQAHYYLQDDDKYCCLGVACKVLIPDDKLRYLRINNIAGQKPDDQPNAPIWLKELNNEFEQRAGVSLTHLNDYGAFYAQLAPHSEHLDRFTFPEIATLLELVYIHKMLD